MANNPDYFGAQGCGNPEVFYPGFAAVKRSVDFSVSPLDPGSGLGDNGSFLALPSMMVVQGILVKEVEKCSQGTLKVVQIPATANGSPVQAASVSVGNSTPAKAWSDTLGDTLLDKGAMLALSCTSGLTAGKVEVTVVGFVPDGDSRDNFELPTPYKATVQTVDNVSGGDLYLANLAAKRAAASAEEEDADVDG